jgi:hypothetical protein
MYNNIFKLSMFFEKLAIRTVMYDPKQHEEYKYYESNMAPEDIYGEAEEYGKTKKFDMQYFSGLWDPVEIRLYAHRRLQMLGQGSSRATYAYSPRFALKIATNEAGRAQNQLEDQISQDKQFNEIIAKVVKSDNDHNWVLSELVRPIHVIDDEGFNDEFMEKMEFEQHSPVPFDTLMQGINPKYRFDDEEAPKYKQFVKQSPQKDEIRRKVRKARALIKKYNLQLVDIKTPSNWGQTSDGRMVVLDFGFDQNVNLDYYGTKRPKNWPVDPTDYGPLLPQDMTIKENPNAPKKED